jgi:hypothetical protein
MTPATALALTPEYPLEPAMPTDPPKHPQSSSKTRRARQIAESMSRAMRARLRVVEAREHARKVAAEVREGVNETAALSEARGTEFVKPKTTPGLPSPPIRRKAGLDWLITRAPARITEAQKLMGERWGVLWRASTGEVPIRAAIIGDTFGGGGEPIWSQLGAAESRIKAGEKLEDMNAILLHQASLIQALVAICGKEQTPREASRDGHSALRLECLCCVALDMLVEGTRLRSAA